MEWIALGMRVDIHRNPCNTKNRIETWNLRTMLRKKKLANVIGEIKSARLDILELSDVTWKEEGDFVGDTVMVIFHRWRPKRSGQFYWQKWLPNVSLEDLEIDCWQWEYKPIHFNMQVMQVYIPPQWCKFIYPPQQIEEEADDAYDVIEERLGNVKRKEYTIVIRTGMHISDINRKVRLRARQERKQGLLSDYQLIMI